MNSEINEIIKKNKLKRKKLTSSPRKDHEELPKNLKYLKFLISRVLLAVIFVLGSMIFVNLSETNKKLYQTHVLENSIQFNKINKWYQSLFGKVDITGTSDHTKTVFSNSISYTNSENYKNGVKLTMKQQEVIHVVTSGIVVYLGDKEDLGNTVIIQGNDGVDIWYSNLTDTNIKLYDYVESGSILGLANSDYIILTLMKDGKYLSYEDYKKQI